MSRHKYTSTQHTSLKQDLQNEPTQRTFQRTDDGMREKSDLQRLGRMGEGTLRQHSVTPRYSTTMSTKGPGLHADMPDGTGPQNSGGHVRGPPRGRARWWGLLPACLGEGPSTKRPGSPRVGTNRARTLRSRYLSRNGSGSPAPLSVRVPGPGHHLSVQGPPVTPASRDGG